MLIEYKQKCCVCRRNYVTVTRRDKYAVCYDCQKKQMEGEIKDIKMKELFDIPEEYYKKSMFLRSIKINYLKYGNLTKNQIEAFKKVAGRMNDGHTRDESANL